MSGRRVCHLVSGDTWGGLEALVLALARTQHRSGSIEVSLLLLNDGRLAATAREAGLAVWIVAERGLGLRPLARAVGAALNDIRPEVVHSHRYKENLLAFLLAPARKIRCVVTIHGFEPPTRIGARVRVALRDAVTFRLGYRAEARFAAVSTDLLDRYRIRPDAAHVVPNGVAVPDHITRPAVWTERMHTEPPTIGWIGRMVPIKALELLIEAFRRLPGGESPPQLVLIGDGPERGALEQQVANAGLSDRVLFTGFVTDPERWFEGMDLFVLPSHHEGAPIALLDALAHGVPVIASAVGGIPDIIGASGGAVLVRERDAASWASALGNALAHPEEMARIGRRGRELVKREYSLERMAARYAELYGATPAGGPG